MLSDTTTGKPFKPAPAKFVEQLDEAAEGEPQAAWVAQYVAGERYIAHKRRSELLFAAAVGGLCGGAAMLIGWFVLLPVVAVVASAAAWYALSANRAHFESKAGVLQNEQSIRMIEEAPEPENVADPVP